MAGPQPGLEQIAHDLYGLSPEEFTAARTAAEKAARSSGDRGLAAAVKALRRPPLAAWAVNQLVRERAELVQQVVELGAALREAQSLLQGDALRDLTRQRRQLVAGVTTEARRLAAEHGQRLSDAAARQVEETLQAAMADPAAAEAVLTGLLAQPLTSTGLESLAAVLAVAPGPAPGEPAAQPGEEPGAQPGEEPGARPGGRPALTVVRDDGLARREAEARAQAARRAVTAATAAHDKARKRQEKAQARMLQIEAELDELRRRVAELEAASEEAAAKLEEREADVDQAQATLEDAEHEAAAAAAALDELG